MRCTARFAWAAWLVVAVACSDDGLSVQDLNSSSTAADTGNVDPTSSATTSPVTGEDISGTGSDGPAGTTHGDHETGSGTSQDDSTGETPTTGPADGTDGTTGMGASDTGTTDTGTSDTGTTGCDPITDDPSGIGGMCRSDLDCLPGYTCQPFEGIVFQTTCQILCTQACECPMGLACIETADKSGSTWYQCG